MKQNDYGRTDERAHLVTSSLLELLIAAKKMLEVFWIYISSYMKATKMVLIWLEIGDPPVHFENRTTKLFEIDIEF